MGKAAWIILIYFAISAIGGVLSRRARKAQEERRSGRRVSTPTGEVEMGPLGQEPPPPPARSTPRRQTPEEIAAEIRRVMGLDEPKVRQPPPRPVEVIEESYESSYDVDYEFDPDSEPSHGGGLRDTIQAREQSGRHGPGRLEARQLSNSISDRHPGSDVGSRSLGSLAGRYGSAKPVARIAKNLGGSRGSAYVDISDMARALVTMEVLGKPIALREDW